VLAVCSCTILPLFAGIYKKGAGLGPAITFLFVARPSTFWRYRTPAWPSVWILPWRGWCFPWSLGIGNRPHHGILFRDDDARHAAAGRDGFAAQARVPRRVWLFWAAVGPVGGGHAAGGAADNSYAHFTLPIPGVDTLKATLARWVPVDASQGRRASACRGRC
jgi:hypothetical protein